MPHQFDDHRRDRLGQDVIIGRVVGDMHLADARDLGRGFRNLADARSGDDQMDLAELGGSSHHRERRVLDRARVMLDPYQRLHAATPIALSLATSSSTSATFMPAVRLGGSETLTVSIRGVVSTP